MKEHKSEDVGTQTGDQDTQQGFKSEQQALNKL